MSLITVTESLMLSNSSVLYRHNDEGMSLSVLFNILCKTKLSLELAVRAVECIREFYLIWGKQFANEYMERSQYSSDEENAEFLVASSKLLYIFSPTLSASLQREDWGSVSFSISGIQVFTPAFVERFLMLLEPAVACMERRALDSLKQQSLCDVVRAVERAEIWQ